MGSVQTAFISDVHANMPALEAVIGKISDLDVEKVICLGDLVGYGPHPNSVLDFFRSNPEIDVIEGNHDAAVNKRPGSLTNMNFDVQVFASAHYRDLSIDNRKYLKSLSSAPKLVLGDRVGLSHGMPSFAIGEYDTKLFVDESMLVGDGRDDRNRDLYYYRVPYPRRVYPSVIGAEVYAVGHAHIPGIHIISVDGDVHNEVVESGDVSENSAFMSYYYASKDDRVVLFNPGSVGQPRVKGDPRAAFAVLKLEDDGVVIDFHRVDYDYKKTLNDLRNAGEVGFANYWTSFWSS